MTGEAITAIVVAVWTLVGVYVTFEVVRAVREIRAARADARRRVADALERRANRTEVDHD